MPSFGADAATGRDAGAMAGAVVGAERDRAVGADVAGVARAHAVSHAASTAAGRAERLRAVVASPAHCATADAGDARAAPTAVVEARKGRDLARRARPARMALTVPVNAATVRALWIAGALVALSAPPARVANARGRAIPRASEDAVAGAKARLRESAFARQRRGEDEADEHRLSKSWPISESAAPRIQGKATLSKPSAAPKVCLQV